MSTRVPGYRPPVGRRPAGTRPGARRRVDRPAADRPGASRPAVAPTAGSPAAGSTAAGSTAAGSTAGRRAAGRSAGLGRAAGQGLAAVRPVATVGVAGLVATAAARLRVAVPVPVAARRWAARPVPAATGTRRAVAGTRGAGMPPAHRAGTRRGAGTRQPVVAGTGRGTRGSRQPPVPVRAEVVADPRAARRVGWAQPEGAPVRAVGTGRRRSVPMAVTGSWYRSGWSPVARTAARRRVRPADRLRPADSATAGSRALRQGAGSWMRRRAAGSRVRAGRGTGRRVGSRAPAAAGTGVPGWAVAAGPAERVASAVVAGTASAAAPVRGEPVGQEASGVPVARAVRAAVPSCPRRASGTHLRRAYRSGLRGSPPLQPRSPGYPAR